MDSQIHQCRDETAEGISMESGLHIVSYYNVDTLYYGFFQISTLIRVKFGRVDVDGDKAIKPFFNDTIGTYIIIIVKKINLSYIYIFHSYK